MKTKWLVLGTFGALFSLAQACGGDDDGTPSTGTGGTSAEAGSGGGTAGTTTTGGTQIKDGTNITFGATCTGNPPFADQSCLNSYCPDVYKVKPILNEAGDCCKRVDLLKANEGKPAEQRVWEWRLMSFKFLSLSETLALKLTNDLFVGFQDFRAMTALLRLTGDISKDGKLDLEMGPGTFNCDGTYSFVAKGVAPSTGQWSTDPNRYASVLTTANNWYPAEGRIDNTWENQQKGIVAIPLLDYLSKESVWPQAYELPIQGFVPLKLPFAADKPDCAGTRSEGIWNGQGLLETYLRMDITDKTTNIIGTGNMAMSLCQLSAFYLLKTGDEKTTTCTSTPRCDKAVDSTCVWKELPDSLCPAPNSDEENSYRCHLGDKKKVDELMAKCDSEQYTDSAPKEWCVMAKKFSAPLCSNTAPKSLADPPQCCDPLGKDTAIPACNSWRMVVSFTAASVEITDQPSTKVPSNCPAK
jgi:hypothetical protein